MKVAKLYDFGDIRIEEMDLPDINSDEMLVKVKACGICSSDTMKWYVKKKAPIVIGHEISGVVVEVGENVDKFKPGDRVFVHHHAPCMECRYCKRGNYVMCDVWKNSKIIPGGIAEFIKVPNVNLRNDTLKLPDHLSFEDGAIVEPVACSVKAFKRAGVKKGDYVVILGLGFMGQVNVKLAKFYGAELTIGVDKVKYRLEKAIENGADYVIDFSNESVKEKVFEITGGYGADVVIVGPGTIEAIYSGLEIVAKGGKLVLFTPTPDDAILEIKPYEVYFKEISIIPSYSAGPDDTVEALELISKGIIKAEKFVTHRFKIENTLDAFMLTASAGESLKCMIVFD
ncbi:L-iditol 2-dehydrogenase [Candidatus Kryptobacter tengchongensis]|uniref:L-iditol 2-dehydrogenase n=1 Tax=Kryptobacter tengchongensis TaxID=1643429 RepID=A0A916PF57_KRYT1|nr:alcohol dehydrogenase catalytic domain-containing protein [Candidatus Kryptobacter tengchongensis]CUT05526.1 L-iditol 2-dehydrogenase [Candidatus Kryptobacter tengchongensis]CUU06366.1 L-iditol 2-dehydrogenase [Candidatus Kryptobacter tengchongensis]